jgi:hypothetical protein
MFCSNCGSQNNPETKFCTRCGNSLAASGTSPAPLQSAKWDEEILKLLRESHIGRRKALEGVTLIGGGVVIMLLLTLVGMNPMAAFWVVSWLYGWGTIELAFGLSGWVASNGTLKTLGTLSPGSVGLAQPPKKFPATSTSGPAGAYSTGPVEPIEIPGSVTEHTTRILKQREQ